MPVYSLSEIFEDAVRRACGLVPQLSHVDPSRVIVLAHRLPPTRLGQTIGFRHGRRPLRAEGTDALYAVSFSARLLAAQGGTREHDALDTVMHELWHLAEACDGTIRPMRHGRTFDAIVRTMRRAYLRAGGEPLPTLSRDARVVARYLGRREGDAFPIRERVTTLARLVPATREYVCPFGHVVVRHRAIGKPSSCARCSPVFDRRYLLRENETTA